MSEFDVRVVEVGHLAKHENADSLSVTMVDGYPVIVRTGDFSEADRAIYVPIDSVVPDVPEWAFLGGHRRIKAKRLRGIFSMGLLAHLPPCECQPLWDAQVGGEWKLVDGTFHDRSCSKTWSAGQNVQNEMKIEKWEPTIHAGKIRPEDQEPEQPFLPRYTDIEGLRRHGDVLVLGEEVVLTEKIHGANGRWLFRDGRLWIGSHNCLWKEGTSNIWTRVADGYLGHALVDVPGLAFYGEVFGDVQDLKYGRSQGTLCLMVFDVMDTSTLRYLDHDEATEVCDRLGFLRVPVLYRGPWSDLLAEGMTTVSGGHVREGFVVKPTRERFDHRVGRVILKLIGEGYLLRKGA